VFSGEPALPRITSQCQATNRPQSVLVSEPHCGNVMLMAKRTSPIKRKNARTATSWKDRDGERPSARKKAVSCPIVGIGGSAGGFEAAMEFLHHLPPKNGMAFVILQHLDPRHASRLPNLLGRTTEMPVIEVTKRVKPQPNTVYVQPPNKFVILRKGSLTLVKRTERPNLAIDHFLKPMA